MSIDARPKVSPERGVPARSTPARVNGYEPRSLLLAAACRLKEQHDGVMAPDVVLGAGLDEMEHSRSTDSSTMTVSWLVSAFRLVRARWPTG